MDRPRVTYLSGYNPDNEFYVMLRFIARGEADVPRGRLSRLERLIHEVYERVVGQLGIPRRSLKTLKLVHQEVPRLSPTSNYEFNRLVYICRYPDRIIPLARWSEMDRVFLEAAQQLQTGMTEIWE